MSSVLGVLWSEVQRACDQGMPGFQLSLASSMRTGSAKLDVFLCMLIPVFLRVLGKYLPGTVAFFRLDELLGLLKSIVRRGHIRHIEYVEGGKMRFHPLFGDMGDPDSTDRNNILQKAIRLYIAHKYRLVHHQMEMTLVPGTKRVNKGFSGTFAQLQSFALSAFPQRGDWVTVDKELGIDFMQTVQKSKDESKDASSANVETKTLYSIRAYGGDADVRVQRWLDSAFAWYKEMRQEDEEDKTRNFFVAVRPKIGDKDQAMTFKRYGLSEHKTFESLFFPQKQALLQIVDDFTAQRGKFGIKGYPNKLGLLLHGPPGTGKTSLIKALAAHTKRHIVSVNLAKVKTNEELMDLFFDLVFPVKGAEFPLTLNFENVVFVMEDIDAASKVVYARTEGKKLRKRRRPHKGAPATGGTHTPESAGSPDHGGAGLGLDSESSDEEEEAPDATQAITSLVECVQTAISSSAALAAADESDNEAKRKGPPLATAWQHKEEDALNLAGLLNVLDGVVDSPGRILVMTTNHPEKLDPALIRPGRINKQIHLGPMSPACMEDMIEHYLGSPLQPDQRKRLSNLELSPAQVEQACAEAEGSEALLRLLDPS